VARNHVDGTRMRLGSLVPKGRFLRKEFWEWTHDALYGRGAIFGNLKRVVRTPMV